MKNEGRQHTHTVFLQLIQLFSQYQVYIPNKKTTYGAWYLNPKTWKKRPANEPLRDPSLTEDSEFEQQPTEKVSDQL